MIRTLKFGGVEERMTFPDSDLPATVFVLVPKEDVERTRALVDAAGCPDCQWYRGCGIKNLALLHEASGPQRISWCDPWLRRP